MEDDAAEPVAASMEEAVEQPVAEAAVAEPVPEEAAAVASMEEAAVQEEQQSAEAADPAISMPSEAQPDIQAAEAHASDPPAPPGRLQTHPPPSDLCRSHTCL